MATPLTRTEWLAECAKLAKTYEDTMTPNHDEGYLDGLHGRTNRECSPNYVEGWEAGWRERMLTWGRAAQPAPDLTHDAEGRN